MKHPWNFLSLLLWVTQLGLSLILAVRLQQRYELGTWIVLLLGLVGFLTSVSTARSCIRSLRKAAEKASDQKDPPASFNDHE